MIVTIRSKCGFYKVIEVKDLKHDWNTYLDLIGLRIDFKIQKNAVAYDYVRLFYAPTIIQLTELVEHYHNTIF